MQLLEEDKNGIKSILKAFQSIQQTELNRKENTQDEKDLLKKSNNKIDEYINKIDDLKIIKL